MNKKNQSYKVLHICSYYKNVLYKNLVDEEIKLGIKPRVFYFNDKVSDMANTEDEYVDARRNFNKVDRILFHVKHRKVAHDFFGFYHKADFDLLHAHSLFSNGYIAYMAHLKWGIPYVVAVQNTDVNSFFKKAFYLRKLGVEILKNAQKIIFYTPSYKKYVLEMFIPEDFKIEIQRKSRILPIGIDKFWFQNMDVAKENMKPLTLITVGTIDKNKNHIMVAKAIKKLQEENSERNFQYIVVGEVISRRILKKLAKYSFVKYVEKQSKEQLLQWYRQSDIFILLSKTETFGLVYPEAMTQGLPVVYTKGEGFDGHFENGVVGYSTDIGKLSSAKDSILKAMQFHDSLSKQAIENVDQFKWEIIAKQYYSLYEQIIQ